MLLRRSTSETASDFWNTIADAGPARRLRSCLGARHVLAVELEHRFCALCGVEIVTSDLRMRSSVDFRNPEGPMKAVTLFW